jgi:uncharacterized protein (TIGR04255 family)
MADPEMLNREIYPTAPVRLVAFELRMPHVPEFAHNERATSVYDRLRDQLPILAPGPGSVRFESSGGGASFSSPLRMLDRRRMLSVMIAQHAIVVETTNYVRFEAFRDVVASALAAASEAAKLPGIERVGLRYIDEIRVPGIATPADWEGFINSALLGPLALEGEFAPEQFEAIIIYPTGRNRQANVRYGALEGRVVEGNGPLRLPFEADGPYFLLDIDSFWSAPAEEVPPFSVDRVLDICASLRRPVRALFEAAITDRLRDEVLRKEAG